VTRRVATRPATRLFRRDSGPRLSFRCTGLRNPGLLGAVFPGPLPFSGGLLARFRQFPNCGTAWRVSKNPGLDLSTIHAAGGNNLRIP